SINFVNATNAAPVWSTVTNVTATTATGASYSGAGTGELVVGNLAATTWFRARVINGACSVITDEVKITVSPAAKAGTVTSPTTVCTGGSITFTSAAYTGSAIAWEVSTTSATTGFSTVAGANELTFTMDNVTLVAPGQKFYVRSVVTSGACTQARSAVRTVTVDPTSVAGTVTGAGIVCSGGGATLRLAGNVGLIQWEYSADGVDYVNVPTATVGSASSFSTTSATGTSATYVLTNVTAGTYFRAKVTSGSCSASYTTPVQMVIGTEAVAGTATAASSTICAASGTTITLTGNVGAIQWQRSSNWTAATPTWTAVSNATASTLATGNLTATTAFRAILTSGSCTATTSAYVVTVSPLAKAATISGNSLIKTLANAICTTTTAPLTLGSGTVGTIQWQFYNAGSSATAVTATTANSFTWTDIAGANASVLAASSATIGNVWFRVKMTSGPCSVVYSAPVNVWFKSCTTREEAPITIFTV
ncbi:MAG: hypothetical protein EAY68_10445, partial [Bacteroidetes bacterium]